MRRRIVWYNCSIKTQRLLYVYKLINTGHSVWVWKVFSDHKKKRNRLRLFESEVMNTISAPMGAARIIYIERVWEHPENLLNNLRLSCLRIFLRIALELWVSTLKRIKRRIEF
jgi:hypothetical protein